MKLLKKMKTMKNILLTINVEYYYYNTLKTICMIQLFETLIVNCRAWMVCMGCTITWSVLSGRY